MLKKQTVWLLTMLSLMIVLSVYYMTSPDSDGDLAYNDQNEKASEEASSDEASSPDKPKNEGDEDEVDAEAEADVGDMSNRGEDQLFASIRMDIQDERSEMKDQLDDVVASSTASVEEKSKARDEMNQLNEISKKESILENSIIAAADYKDVLVRHDDDVVHVRVKETKQLSNSEVVNIMQMVRDEFGEITVDVVQPSED
ncbi:SpoIIIAH-like family protein [Barrientosiimonas marina]|uniref:SpoIIIAH-like family protein n=1 Tax=Lentibacillus kimchii TaxID=1542911 RepID=A0ABW2UW55_9BACI